MNIYTILLVALLVGFAIVMSALRDIASSERELIIEYIINHHAVKVASLLLALIVGALAFAIFQGWGNTVYAAVTLFIAAHPLLCLFSVRRNNIFDVGGFVVLCAGTLISVQLAPTAGAIIALTGLSAMMLRSPLLRLYRLIS